jgi:DnaJ-class molecular chaperone
MPTHKQVMICPTCNGSGEGLQEGLICRDCKGMGSFEIEDKEEE